MYCNPRVIRRGDNQLDELVLQERLIKAFAETLAGDFGEARFARPGLCYLANSADMQVVVLGWTGDVPPNFEDSVMRTPRVNVQILPTSSVGPVLLSTGRKPAQSDNDEQQ